MKMPIFIDSDDDSDCDVDVEIESTELDTDGCCPPKNLFFNSQYLFSIIDVADIYNYNILENPNYENLDTFLLKLKPSIFEIYLLLVFGSEIKCCIYL